MTTIHFTKPEKRKFDKLILWNTQRVENYANAVGVDPDKAVKYLYSLPLKERDAELDRWVSDEFKTINRPEIPEVWETSK